MVHPGGTKPAADSNCPKCNNHFGIETSNCQARRSLQSKDRLQPLVGNDVQQLERRPCGTGIAVLPLAHGRCGCVQMMRKHRLTEIQPLAQAPNIGSTKLPHRRRAKCIEVTHRHLANYASIMQCSEISAQRLNDLARHNTPPSVRPSARPSSDSRWKATRTPCPRIAEPASRSA